ncbi:MAG: ATP-binding protein [Bacteroidota bacterium]
MNQIDKVSIALQPSVYNTFRALNNTVALTLSEYVDNSVQSYLDNKQELLQNNDGYVFTVSIEVDQKVNQIVIKDNAAGIDFNNYKRAFEPANIPLDNTKLNEFGMGMKTASVWLADKWSVRTKALGENVERYTEFDLHKVIAENKEELIVKESIKDKKAHYTEIILSQLSHNSPSPNQMDKVRRHLSSIYRIFLRNKEIEIIVNGEHLQAPNYEVLNVPYFNDPKGQDVLWKKEINFQIGKYKANGFIAILKTIQNNANGLVLLRRGRVIVGGDDDRFFPSSLFGSAGNFRYKRLFGELQLEGFGVTFNKNGFTDEENLIAFIDALRDELREPGFNLLSQADNFRVKTKEENSKIAERIVKTHKKEVEKEPITDKIKKVEDLSSNHVNIKKNEQIISNANSLGSVEDFFEYDSISYKFQVDLINEDESDALYSVKQIIVKKELLEVPCIICKINLAHPFFNRFEQFKKANDYEPIVEIFKSFALAEFIATSKSMHYPSELRTIFNNYIVQ